MKKLKKEFEENPIFAATVIIAGASVLTAVLKSTSQMIEASAYAYRASKM